MKQKQTPTATNNQNRRPVSSRDVGIFQKIAQTLVRRGFHPNQISVASAVFGVLAGVALFESSQFGNLGTILWLLIALAGIQLRLICNLIDGLMAVEGGLKTPTGELYNDFPDRVSDVAILVGAGYSAAEMIPWASDLGWIAATLSVMTAYTRVLGASIGTPHFFVGPMAKQHRMFVMNIACFGAIAETVLGVWGYSFSLALALISLGCLITVLVRLKNIVRDVTRF